MGRSTEHGDGFNLSFAAPDDLDVAAERGCAAVADGVEILVLAGEALRGASLIIDWRRWRFTYETLAP